MGEPFQDKEGVRAGLPTGVELLVGTRCPVRHSRNGLGAPYPEYAVHSGYLRRSQDEIVAELEPDRRGVYAGAVGYFDFSGNMDTAIAIRTLIVKDGIAYAQAGGGIVYDSTPEAEYMETVHKASATLRAIDQAEAEMG